MRRDRAAALLVVALAGAASCNSGDDEPGAGGSGGFPGLGGSGGDDARFDLSVQGTGYTSHVGEDLWAALVDLGSMEVVTRLGTPAKVSAGATFSFEMGDVLEKGHAYRVDFYADHNMPGNGKCDAPSLGAGRGDHGWAEPVKPVKGDVSLNVSHSFNFFENVCLSFAEDPGPFDLRFSGSNYTSHRGETVRVKLVDVASDQVVATADPPPVVTQDATLTFRFDEAMARGLSYKLVYYADHNMPGNGTCERPADHVWSELIDNVRGDVVINKEHIAQFDAGACKYFR